MKVRLFVIILTIAYFVLLPGCKTADIDIGPKREVSQYSEKTINVEQPVELELTGDSNNVEIYSWNKKEVKFEITKRVRGIYTKNVMEKKLNDFKINIKNESNKISFISQYKGSIKNAADRSVDLKIYIPKKVKSMNYKLDTGTLKIYDDVNCGLNAVLSMVNTEINKFNGLINLKADMGDLRISNGKIASGSSIVINMGNIRIKSEFENEGDYNFETNMGNIDINLPKDTQVKLETIGSVETDVFKPESDSAKIRARSGMGKITITKY